MEESGGLPGLDAPRDDRIVLHVDNDCFYASCERLREPALRGEPLVIGMGYDEDDARGAVATASYEARAAGIESAQPISEAIELLPPRSSSDDADTAHYRPVDMAFYESVAEEVKSILEDIADIVRHVSIDEAYLDCTETTTWDDVESFGQQLKQTIADEVGIPVSVGVGPTMGVAKVASDLDKPDGLAIVRPHEIDDVLHPLPIDELHGIGPVTARDLAADGIETIGDFAAQDPSWIVERYGERGRDLYRRARGVDAQSVTPRGDPKSLSRESSIDGSELSADEVRDVLRELARAVAARAERKGATYRTIGIKVVTPPFDVNTRERSLSGPVADADLVVDTAFDLLEEFEDATVRKLGVRVSNLSFVDGNQADLGSWAGRGDRADTDRVRPRGGQARLSEFVDRS